MADGPKKTGGWGDALDDNETAAPGVSKEMIRRALSMNPNLRNMTNTNDAMRDLKKSGAAAATPVTAPAAQAPVIDLFAAMDALVLACRSEQKSIADEQARLKTRGQELLAQAQEQVMRVVLAADPNMVSPKTAEVLVRHKAFLTEVGFSAKKLVDWQAAQKK